MSVSREEIEKCRGCKEATTVRAQDGWHFTGCMLRKRQWIAQIEKCEYRDRPRKVETVLEKVKKKNPTMRKNGLPVCCPSYYGFEDCEDAISDNGLIKCTLSCEECWNREEAEK